MSQTAAAMTPERAAELRGLASAHTAFDPPVKDKHFNTWYLLRCLSESLDELERRMAWDAWMQTDAAQRADLRVVAEAIARGDRAPS